MMQRNQLRPDCLLCVQVVTPSPFKFLNSRKVLDVTCGADFVAVVLKKSGQVRRKLVNKNNYVIVHRSESDDDSNLSDSSSNQNRGEFVTVSKCPFPCPSPGGS